MAGYCPADFGAVITTWQVPLCPVVHFALVPTAETTICLPDTTPLNEFHEPSRVAESVKLLPTAGELGEALKTRVVFASFELLVVDELVELVEVVGLLVVELFVVDVGGGTPPAVVIPTRVDELVDELVELVEVVTVYVTRRFH